MRTCLSLQSSCPRQRLIDHLLSARQLRPKFVNISFSRESAPLQASTTITGRRYSSNITYQLSTSQHRGNEIAVKFHEPESGKGRIRVEEWPLDIKDHINERRKAATVIIQNIGSGNALTPSLLQVLKKVFQEFASRKDLCCVILTSVKGSFCTGMHVGELAKLESPDQAKRFILDVGGAAQAIRDLPVVTIAQIDGRCFGAGLELAASCDFRFATQDSTFAMPEVELGIPSVVQARLLANIIGWQKTRRLLLTGGTIGAEVASRWGLIDEVSTTTKDLVTQVQRTVRQVSDNAPVAMKAQKRLINYWEENDLQSGVEASVDVFAAMFDNGAAEPKQYMERFFMRKQEAKERFAIKYETLEGLDTEPDGKGEKQAYLNPGEPNSIKTQDTGS